MIRARVACGDCGRRTVARQLNGGFVRNCCKDADPDAQVDVYHRTRDGKKSTEAQTEQERRHFGEAYALANRWRIGDKAARAFTLGALRRPCGPSDGLLLAMVLHELSRGDRADLIAALVTELET